MHINFKPPGFLAERISSTRIQPTNRIPLGHQLCCGPLQTLKDILPNHMCRRFFRTNNLSDVCWGRRKVLLCGRASWGESNWPTAPAFKYKSLWSQSSFIEGASNDSSRIIEGSLLCSWTCGQGSSIFPKSLLIALEWWLFAIPYLWRGLYEDNSRRYR